MKIYCVCRKKFIKEDNSKYGDTQYLTVDGAWTEIFEYSAIFRKEHAMYLAEKHECSQKKLDKDYNFDWSETFSIKEILNATIP